ncbi:MAG: hypothetical protein CM1200mP2_43530 [Planctomycetaceae bacterium]|nr:MAG: hypothetical protein CM1200mP2_43530 [Planctomycetaceae bacterium]
MALGSLERFPEMLTRPNRPWEGLAPGKMVLRLSRITDDNEGPRRSLVSVTPS